VFLLIPTTVGVLSSKDVLDGSLLTSVRNTVERGFYLGKAPLFVLGAGISAKRVPFLGEMASRLVGLIHESQGIQRRTKEILIRQGELILEARASRSDAAEFFSTCQIDDMPMSAIWQQFCGELALEGLLTSDGLRRFRGLFRLTSQPDPYDSLQPLCGPSLAHIGIASLMTTGACHVLNLNYDPLLFLAMAYMRLVDGTKIPSHHIISLHTANDINAYYSSTNKDYQPAVINARGDIFYARCANNRCPDFAKDRSLDTRYAAYQEKEEAFRCSSCHLKSIQLQLSFPGYETKERLVEPVLQRLRDFLGHRASVIFPIGLSGQWDPYLLSELFDWSLAYSIPIVDVKPQTQSTPTAFEAFRHRYFPSIPVGTHTEGSWYQQWPSTADNFMNFLHEMIRDTGAFTIGKIDKNVAVDQPSLLLS
jgi:hypothetical protein